MRYARVEGVLLGFKRSNLYKTSFLVSELGRQVRGRMSIQSLKFEIARRVGPELLPTSFPIELLIGMTKKLALVADRSLPHEELQALSAMVQEYLSRVLGMQGPARLNDFHLKANDLIPACARELYDCMCEEIVSRLIEHDVRSMSLQDRLLAVLDDAAEPI